MVKPKCTKGLVLVSSSRYLSEVKEYTKQEIHAANLVYHPVGNGDAVILKCRWMFPTDHYVNASVLRDLLDQNEKWCKENKKCNCS